MKNKEQKKCEMCDEMSKKAGARVFCLEHLPSPTKPDAWEKEFINKFFVYKLGDTYPDPVGAEKIAVEFIRQEKEKSYQRGLKENCIAIDKGNMDWLKGTSSQTADFLKEIRHSAYSEIIEMVEEENESIIIPNCLVQKCQSCEMERHLKRGLTRIISKLKERLTQK